MPRAGPDHEEYKVMSACITAMYVCDLAAAS